MAIGWHLADWTLDRNLIRLLGMYCVAANVAVTLGSIDNHPNEAMSIFMHDLFSPSSAISIRLK